VYIIMHLNDLLKSRRNDILQITAKHGAHNVRVFGSVARGEADSQSDIDLLVEFKRGTTLLGHAALIQELEEFLGVKVDVVSDRGLRERIRDRVLNEAVAL
jgi:predicted nucleotidyltransferase